MRLLYRNCNSDEHRLGDCFEIPSAQRIQYVSLIFQTDSVCANGVERSRALDIARNYDDHSWNDLSNCIHERNGND